MVGRLVLLVVGVALVAGAVYVERHRRSYGPHVHLLSGFSFAGGVAAVALAVTG